MEQPLDFRIVHVFGRGDGDAGVVSFLYRCASEMCDSGLDSEISDIDWILENETVDFTTAKGLN